ncbi:MAG: DEAD/DEAH box helicase, partial [Syntrophomonadaceae bacterium]|nr:DEAD/DEAH box helicase [Syntrophomonadaceae bacterium]
MLRRGEALELDAALRILVELGYERVTTVEAPGTFALRGGILDLYPPGAAEPVRAEFFGDEIESLRRFDVNTQRSGAALQSLQVGWADERAFPPGQAHLLDHVPAGGVVFIDEVREVQATLERDLRRARAFAAAAGRQTPLLTWEAAQQRLQGRPLLYHSLFPSVLPGVKAELVQHITQREMEPLYASPEAVGNRLREWAAQGIAVSIAVRGRKEEARVRQELQRLGVTLPVTFAPWDVERGFVSPTLGMALVSSRDLWGRRTVGGRRRPRGAPALGPAELKVGDYVVHENHGVGLFQGMTRMEVDGVSREYVIIQYAGTDRLYLPVDKLDLLSRYSSTDERQPRLSRLGGSDWERTKKRVRESVREMAQELLQLYARRQAQPGYAFSPDTVWQAEFEAAFEHEETPDQARAVAEIKRDMEAPRPMDRLVCGDVGYGKTEVALRAAFKAVMDHKQVAILVPTTVLAEQHYQTCRQRFGGYPVVVEALSRFRTPQQQKAILAQLQRGVVDVIIGTHRLLSRDVRFKDLGLLIVDEEHRFGVRQKERIKALKSSVDVLSLSATPIPRTLHMALTGLRDLSVIATPPPERYPITTYVMEYHEEILREAIMAEIERGGQVFAVHNRIQDIGAFRDRRAPPPPGGR